MSTFDLFGLPNEILVMVLCSVGDWQDLRNLALASRTLYSLYSNNRSVIDSTVERTVRDTYPPVPIFDLCIKFIPPLLEYDSLSADHLPVKVQFTATNTTPRPIFMCLQDDTPWCWWDPYRRMASWGGASKSGLPCMEVDRLLEYNTSGECTNINALPLNRSRSGPRKKVDPRTWPGKHLNPPALSHYNSSPVAYPQEFHCFRPGESWTSPELEIRNFQVKKGCKYELDFETGDYKDLWWAYGTREEVLENHSDPSLLDSDDDQSEPGPGSGPLDLWSRGFEPYITAYLRKKMMKELMAVHDYERWGPRTKIDGEPWESDEEDPRYRAWRRVYRFDTVYFQVESDVLEVV